jgi:hypothetical protein
VIERHGFAAVGEHRDGSVLFRTGYAALLARKQTALVIERKAARAVALFAKHRDLTGLPLHNPAGR